MTTETLSPQPGMQGTPAESWTPFLLLLTAMAAITNPWSQQWLMELQVQASWVSQSGAEGVGLKIAAELLSVIMLLALIAIPSGAIPFGYQMLRKTPGKAGSHKKRATFLGTAWVVLGVMAAILLTSYISKALTTHLAATLIQQTVEAERHQGFEPAIKEELSRLTKDYHTISANNDFFEAMKGTTYSAEKLMTVLPAVDVLGREHPSVAFILDNGLLRRGDMQAIQKDLFLRVREGDPNARLALAALVGTESIPSL